MSDPASQHQTKAAVIIEWDNIVLSKAERTLRMLKTLKQQIEELHTSHPSQGLLARLSFPVDVVIAFDPKDFTPEKVRGLVESVLQGSSALHLVIADFPGQSFYELKNLGAKKTDADIIVFLDSDVIPDAGWLKAMLESFDNTQVNVAAGVSYIEPTGIYSKAFALGWFFPLQPNTEKLGPTKTFIANTVAFKRSVFDRFPFPYHPEMARGSCKILAATLVKEKVGLYCNSAARVAHPAPNGVRHFFMRGLSQGRDNTIGAILKHGRRGWIAKDILRKFLHLQLKSLRSILHNRKKVNLPVWAVPLALVQMSFYYFLYFLGAVTAFLFPQRAQRWWRV